MAVDVTSVYMAGSGMCNGGRIKRHRRLFPTHGEAEAADSLAGHIRQELGWDATVPEYGDVCELE